MFRPVKSGTRVRELTICENGELTLPFGITEIYHSTDRLRICETILLLSSDLTPSPLDLRPRSSQRPGCVSGLIQVREETRS